MFRSSERGTHEKVALKKMLRHHENEGFPRTETREIKLLKSVQHPNIVSLKEVVTSFGAAGGGAGRMCHSTPPSYAAASTGGDRPDSEGADRVLGATAATTSDRCGDVYLVFEYVDYDCESLRRGCLQSLLLAVPACPPDCAPDDASAVAGLLDSGYSFTLLQVSRALPSLFLAPVSVSCLPAPPQVKSLIFQLLVGLDHLHTECGYMHRDLKCRRVHRGRAARGEKEQGEVALRPPPRTHTHYPTPPFSTARVATCCLRMTIG